MSLIFFLIKDIRSFYSPPEFFKRQRLDSALLPLEALGCFARSVTALTLMNNFTFPIFFSVRVRCFYKFVAFLSPPQMTLQARLNTLKLIAAGLDNECLTFINKIKTTICNDFTFARQKPPFVSLTCKELFGLTHSGE